MVYNRVTRIIFACDYYRINLHDDVITPIINNKSLIIRIQFITKKQCQTFNNNIIILQTSQ